MDQFDIKTAGLIRKWSESDKRAAHAWLSATLGLDHQPNSWDELIKLWSNDLNYKKPLLDWLKDNWDVPRRRHNKYIQH